MKRKKAMARFVLYETLTDACRPRQFRKIFKINLTKIQNTFLAFTLKFLLGNYSFLKNYYSLALKSKIGLLIDSFLTLHGSFFFNFHKKIMYFSLPLSLRFFMKQVRKKNLFDRFRSYHYRCHCPKPLTDRLPHYRDQPIIKNEAK